MKAGATRTRSLLILATIALLAAGPTIPATGEEGQAGGARSGGFETPDDLGKHVFRCLKKGDAEGFLRICVSAGELSRLLGKVGLSESDIEEVMEDFQSEDGTDLLPQKAREVFKEARGSLDWAGAELSRVEHEIDEWQGLRGCTRFVLHVLHDGKSIPVHLESVIRFDEGWKLFAWLGFGVGKRPVGAARPQANEAAAIATLRNICVAQAQFQAIAIADADGDGTGEFGCFRELSGACDVRGRENFGRLHPPVLWNTFKSPDEDGFITRSGYNYALYLPNAEGVAILVDAAKFGEVDADLSESFWCIYAWPVKYGDTTRRTFMTNQWGDVLATECEKYSGRNGPVPDAALHPPTDKSKEKLGRRGCIIDILAVGTKGRDGNVWAQVN